MAEEVLLSISGGGEETQKFLEKIILKYLGNHLLNSLEDSTLLEVSTSKLAFTTDSFTVKPLFFKGGDIGKLSIIGTLNDLAVMGARPRFLSLSLIIEEGFPLRDLERILKSMQETLSENKVLVVTGDTKVVPRGALDGIYINTSGLGEIIYPGLSARNLKPGDVIILTGSIGDHGVCILAEREGFKFEVDLESDCASLFPMLEPLFTSSLELHALRDPTRGGLAGVLYEWARASKVDILIYEEEIPVKPQVRAFCEILGFEPYHFPSEGRALISLPEKEANVALEILRSHPLGRKSKIIGKVLEKREYPRVYLETPYGTRRILELMEGEFLPRIC
ncbi:hydrogenase assembly protein HupF [Caldimicrobium thiodismutans]|uniref:Hydrogenase assembly protein HupF n=1 Tax=Caldimicrobium thiodismutans TaxID=1653476 RepID=A0A0U4W2N0_9BACT|nr:hydrogenase expression/formation protein HypE [Caldimicrobium thiodismutans]BAU23339.1 hydrogenase assembly protein HupF [Caldimicrobium thiodismutans]